MVPFGIEHRRFDRTTDALWLAAERRVREAASERIMVEARVSGSCLCGAVKFTVGLPTLFCGHCHCSVCRRSHGAGFVTWFGVRRSQFQVSRGKKELCRYASSDHGSRTFCGRCGSSLFFDSSNDPDQIEIALANMEGPIDRLPQEHIYFDDRASWVVAEDGLPKLGGSTGFEPIKPDAT